MYNQKTDQGIYHKQLAEGLNSTTKKASKTKGLPVNW